MKRKITAVEKTTLCPHVFACLSEAVPSALKALKQLASKLSARKEDIYADIISLLGHKSALLSYGNPSSAFVCQGRIGGAKSLMLKRGAVVQEERLSV